MNDFAHHRIDPLMYRAENKTRHLLRLSRVSDRFMGLISDYRTKTSLYGRREFRGNQTDFASRT